MLGALRGALAAGILVPALVLAGCGGEAPAPPPPAVELTRDAIGHYCNMIVADHQGPKGQVHVEGRAEPLWFSSVRDAIAYLMLDEEPGRVSAVYVNDMARASWDAPEPGTWIDATSAFYVVGSDARGGMGAPELVPFSTREVAEAFVRRHGGRVVGFDGIPREAVLAGGGGPGVPAGAEGTGGQASAPHVHGQEHGEAERGTATGSGADAPHGAASHAHGPGAPGAGRSRSAPPAEPGHTHGG